MKDFDEGGAKPGGFARPPSPDRRGEANVVERVLDGALERVRAIARLSAWATGTVLLLAALVIAYDVSIRYFLNQTMGGGTEIAGYSLAIASTWGITVTLLRRSHVRIDAVYAHLARRLRALLDIFGLAALISFMALVTRYAYGVLEQSYISGTRSVSVLEVPLIIPQAFWLAGLVFFLGAATLLLLRSTLAFLKGDLARVHTLIGARSTSEEVDAEQVRRSAGRTPERTDPRGAA